MIRNSVAIVALVGSWALSGAAWGQECAQTIEGNDQLQFNLKEIRVGASCGEVTITLRHVGMLPANVMGHNIVITRTADYNAVAMAGQEAGAPNYLPSGDARVIAASEVIGGGQETSITVDVASLEAGGDYTFFCSFPGHYVLMNGKFIVE